MQKTPTKLATFVVDIMKKNTLSSYDVERRSGDTKKERISQSSVSKIINGDTKNPKIPTLKALAKGLGIPEAELIAVTTGKQAESVISRTIASYINELPENVQEDVLLIVESLYKKYVK